MSNPRLAKSCCIALLTFFVLGVQAGPFGLHRGMTLAEIRAEGNLTPLPSNPMWFTTTALRNGHVAFTRYDLLISETRGLCVVEAYTNEVRTKYWEGHPRAIRFDAVDAKIRLDFRDLERALQEKYGKPSRTLDVAETEWKNFMYWSIWDKGLPDKIDSITLSLWPMVGSGGIQLSYEFLDSDACRSESKRKKNANL